MKSQTLQARVGFKTFVLASFVAVFSFGCNGSKNQTNIELAPNMFDQPSIKAQDWDPKRTGVRTQLQPPENTMPRNHKAYAYTGNIAAAEQKLKNPYAGQFTPELIELGKKQYNIYCMVCHGEAGAGKGSVAPKMTLKPANLLQDKIRKYKDGRLYHVIVDGYGVMGSYANQIQDEKARWAIVNYVRQLQLKAKN